MSRPNLRPGYEPFSHPVKKRPLDPVIYFTRRIEPEHIPFEGNVMASGDDRVDRETEDWVQDQLDSGNEAAWCQAVVIASVDLDWWVEGYGTTIQGRDNLGGCSYESEKQLWEDLSEDMEHQAVQDLLREIRHAASMIENSRKAPLLILLDQLLEKYG